MKDEAEAIVDTAKGVLQEIVVVVSLVRALTDAFGSASDLYRKLKRKSHHRCSDEEKDPGFSEHTPIRGRRHSCAGFERNHHYHVSWKDSKKEEYCDSDEELILTSSIHVRAEYDRGYRKLGETFARGDLTTQTQLQWHIIQLQQVQLTIHQDLLVSTYLTPSSSHSHLLRLVQTTRTARSASILALNLQYKRMLPPIVPKIPEPRLPIPGAFPLPPLHGGCEDHRPILRRPSRRKKRSDSSSSSSSSSSSDSDKPMLVPKPKPKPILHRPGHRLFCVYAKDLQRDPNLPLTDNYKVGGDHRCPFCHSHISTRPGKAWEIVLDGGKSFDGQIKMLSRRFLVKNRFVIKSHRENGGFACLLCARFKSSDTVCREIGSLMEHLWRDHTGDELGKDEDIVES